MSYALSLIAGISLALVAQFSFQMEFSEVRYWVFVIGLGVFVFSVKHM